MARPLLSDAERRELLRGSGGSPPLVLGDRSAEEITLSGLTFIGARFFNISFAYADFRGTKFEDVTFENCDFNQANFSDARLLRVKFLRCNLANTKSQRVTVDQTQISDCNVGGMLIAGGKLLNTTLMRATGEGFIIRTSLLESVNINQSELDRMKIEESDLHETTFDESTIKKFKFTEGNWRNFKFQNGILEDGAFDRVHSAMTSFTNSTVKAVRIFGGHHFRLQFTDCPLLEDVGFDSTDLKELEIVRSPAVAPLLLNCTVAAMKLTQSTIAYLDISQTRLDGASFANLVMQGLSFLASQISGLQIENSEISGALRQEGSSFKALRLVGVQYGADYKKEGAQGTFVDSDSFL